MDVALVSCVSLPEPDPDAAPLARALADAGIAAEVLAWDDPLADVSRARLTVLRSCWNYPRNPEAFLNWVAGAAAVSEVWNPLSVVRWNTHKRYLLELAGLDLPVVPTVLLDRGSAGSLAGVLAERGWDDVVIKPAVSAASYRTRRIGRETLDSGEAHLTSLLACGDVLIQPYLSSVEGWGERALIWIDGELTHAVRKSPRFEDQAESVSAQAVAIEPNEAHLARRVLGAIEHPLLYARVDTARGPDGLPLVMELELVEPSLFFTQCPAALARFVAAVERRLIRPPQRTGV